MCARSFVLRPFLRALIEQYRCLVELLDMTWTWTDNTELEYIYWNPGEPNDVEGTQNCVRTFYQTFANTWDDYICGNGLPYICKVRKGTYKTYFIFPKECRSLGKVVR